MVTRIQFGSTEQLSAAATQAEGTIGQAPTGAFEPSTRVHTGAVRFVVGQSEATTEGPVTRHVMSFSGTPGGSVAQTLQSINGKQTVELIPGDPSSRTLVQTAQRDGLIQRGIGGRWEDAQQRQQQAAPQGTEEGTPEQQPAPEVNPEDAAAFDVQAEAEWSRSIADIPQHAYDNAVASTIGVFVNGTSVDSTARNLAEASGMEPEDARAMLDAGYTLYGNQVIAALAPMGISGGRMDQFVEGLSKNQARYHDAIQKLVYMRDLSGFRNAAAEFLRHNPAP